MAFVVEDGTKPENANSYLSVAEADAYFTDRGITTWTGADNLKQIALVKATDYIEKRFGSKFRGRRESKDQSLSWPRYNAVDDDGFLLSGVNEIPRRLKQATAEYALRALSAALLTDPDNTLPSGQIVEVREKVGPIEEQTKYENKPGMPKSSLVSDQYIPEYPAADLLLQGLLKSGMSRELGRG